MTWILREDGALCLDGYPIRIVVDHSTNATFIVESDWRKKSQRVLTLNYAKMVGRDWAREIDAFTQSQV